MANPVFKKQTFDFQKKRKKATFWRSFPLVLSGLNLVGLGFFSVAVLRLAFRPLPQLVQLSDGELMAVSVKPYYHREPTAIKRFVDQTFKMLFTWSPQYISSDPTSGEQVKKTDLGVSISPGLTVTTPAYEASLAFSEDLRLPFLEKLTHLMPSNFNHLQASTYLKFDYLSDPEALSRDTWRINFVASWVLRQGNSERRIPFNKTVTVRAIEHYGLPTSQTSSFEQSAERIRLSGLQIIDIQDYIP